MNSNSPMKLSAIESKIMEFFFENSEKELFEKEIREKAKISSGAANKYLKILANKGYLKHRRTGRMNFYSLSRENMLVKQMKKAHSLSLPFISKLKYMAKKLGMEICLYGSVARGEDTEKSDIDLLIIGKTEPLILEKELSTIKKSCKKEIRYSLFSRLEWLAMERKDPAFFERVEKDKIRIV